MVTEKMRQRLASADAWSRIMVIQELAAEVPTLAVQELLLPYLGDPVAEVRAATAKALGAHAAHPPLRAALVAALFGRDPDAVVAAVHALQIQCACPVVWKTLLHLLTDPATEDSVRHAAGEALQAQAADPLVFGELVALLRTPDLRVFQATVVALTAQWADASVREQLLLRLQDSDRFVRQIAIRALRCWIHDSAVRAALRTCRDDPDLGVRETARAFLSAE
jgi:HEAT repeat protein